MEKMIKTLVLFILAIIFPTLIFSQWNWQNPLPQNNDLRDISILDESNAFAVGDKGMILKYDGNEWKNELVNADILLMTVHFTSANNAWATGWDKRGPITINAILKYDGNEWNIQSTNLPEFFLPTAAFFLNESKGWVALSGAIYKYENNTWSLDFETTLINHMFFLDENNGWAVGNGGTILFYDGSSWTSQSTQTGSAFQSIHILNENLGWAVTSNGQIHKYNGTDWTLEEDFTGSLDEINFMNENLGWAVGSRIYKYEDGNWTEETTFSFDDIFAMDFSDSDNGWAVGENGELVQIEEINWSSKRSIHDNNIFDIQMVDETYGLAVGGGGFGILSSFNDSSWDFDTLASNQILRSVFLFDDQNGWTVGNNIYKYENGDWNVIQPTLPGVYNSVDFINDTNGWIAGRFGRIFKYDGNIWTEEETSTFSDLSDVHLINENNGWMVGENGIILKYDGNSWEEVESNTSIDLKSVFFNNESNGWAVGNNGKILHYDGSSWEEVESNTDRSLNSVYFLDEVTGWAAGGDGTILKYNGDDWIPQFSGATGNLISIYFINENKGWTVGSEGIILSTSNGGGIITSTTELSEKREVSSLIYPNPTAGTFQIKFDKLEPNQLILINLFDVNGKYIKTIFNGNLNDQNRTLSFSKGNLAKGVYFCQIQMKGFAETKKIIID